MTELEQNLNTILEEKQTKIIPENIKEGITVLGIEGSYSGLDTSDATAAESDILEGKTAYVNGNKITGNLIISDYNIKVENYTGGYDWVAFFTEMKLDCSKATSLQYAFRDMKNLKKLHLKDISKITNYSYAFYNAWQLEEITVDDTNTLDLSNATNTSYMFANNSSSVSGTRKSQLPVNIINTQNVTNMSYMFDDTDFETIPELDCSSCVKISYCLTRRNDKLKNFGGFKNLGKAYTQQNEGFKDYWLTLTYTTGMTHESVMNIINKLYDLNITYNVANGGTLYKQRISLPNDITLTDAEKQIAIDKGWYFA